MLGRVLRKIVVNTAWLLVGVVAWLIAFAFVVVVNILWIFPIFGLVIDLTAARPYVESVPASVGLGPPLLDAASLAVVVTGSAFLVLLGLLLRGRQRFRLHARSRPEAVTARQDPIVRSRKVT